MSEAASGDLDPLVVSPAATARMLAQMDELLRVPGVVERFYGPLPNNFVLLFTGRHRNVRTDLERLQAQTSVLNAADRLVHAGCVAAVRALVENDRSSSLTADLELWRRAITSDANLLGVEPARRVIGALRARGRPLRAETQISDAFRAVPEELRTFIRVNLRIPFAQVIATLGALLDRWRDRPVAVDRIEVGKALEPRWEHTSPPFPSLILTLGLDVTSRPTSAVLASLLDDVVEVCDAVCPPEADPQPPLEHSWTLSPFVSVAQGFRLHKRYLEMLGLLDGEYDRTCGHALVHPSRIADLSFRASLDEVLSKRSQPLIAAAR